MNDGHRSSRVPWQPWPNLELGYKTVASDMQHLYEEHVEDVCGYIAYPVRSPEEADADASRWRMPSCTRCAVRSARFAASGGTTIPTSARDLFCGVH